MTTKPRRELLDWIDWKRMYKNRLFIFNETIEDCHPGIIRESLYSPFNSWLQTSEEILYLEQNPHYLKKVCCFGLSSNTLPEAISLLEKYPEAIKWDYLSENPNAIHLLEENQEKIVWDNLSRNKNPAIIHLLEQNLEKVNWDNLSRNINPAAILILEQNPEKINWDILSGNNNPAAVQLLEINPEKINWVNLSGNINSAAISILEQNPEKIDWTCFSSNINPAVIQLLENNLDKINWNRLSYNRNPDAFYLIKKYINDAVDKKKIIGLSDSNNNIRPEVLLFLEENQDVIYWEHFCKCQEPIAINILENNLKEINNKQRGLSLTCNPAAIHILEKNQHLIYWSEFYQNPAIFKDYGEEMYVLK